MNPLSVVLALCAAASNAASNVLQRKANLEEPSGDALSLRLLWRLGHNRLWLSGLGTVTLSFVLQASALGTGTLAGVQPIIVLELPLTLVVASFVLHSSLGTREWGAVCALTAGLALLLGGLDPHGTVRHSLPAESWIIGIVTSAGVIVGLVLVGWFRPGPLRAVTFGAATGIDFGLTAALMKGTTVAAASGIAHVFSSWTTYAMIVADIAGMFLMQNSLQAGRLVAAQPGITLLDPLAAICWGIFAFGEQVNEGPWLVAAVVGAAAMGVGAVVLGGSPLLEHAEEEDTSAPEPVSRREMAHR